MKSFKQYLTEARPKGQKRYDRDTSKIEARLDRMYAAGGSQKKIDRTEMRLARRTNDGDYDVEDVNIHTAHGQLGVPVANEDDPKVMSLDELMREKARKIYTDNHTHEMVGKEIRDSLVDLSIPTKPYEGVTDHEIGKEAHNILIKRMNLISRIRKNK
jgi:hypothetical protein